jgi:hypothetical protein
MPLKLNGLLHWKKHRSLVLHEEAKAARLEHYRKKNIMVDTVLHGEVASSCAYWVPLEDWRGETTYLKAWGVDDILDFGEMGTPWKDMRNSLSWQLLGMSRLRSEARLT